MAPEPPEGKEEKVRALDEDDIALLKSYGQGPYSARIKDIEKDVKDTVKKVNDVSGIKESDTGLAAPSRWDLVSDKQAMQEEQPLQVGLPSVPLIALHPLHVADRPCCQLRARMSWNIKKAVLPVTRPARTTLPADGSLSKCYGGHRWPGAPRSLSLALRKPSMSST